MSAKPEDWTLPDAVLALYYTRLKRGMERPTVDQIASFLDASAIDLQAAIDELVERGLLRRDDGFSLN